MGLGGRGSHSFWWQPKLAYVNPHLSSCWLLSVGLNETHLMARPNELFIAWLTGSRFSMSLRKTWIGRFRPKLRGLSCSVKQAAFPRCLRLDQVLPIQDIWKQIAVTSFRAHNSALVLSGKWGACKKEYFGLCWQMFSYSFEDLVFLPLLLVWSQWKANQQSWYLMYLYSGVFFLNSRTL